MRSKLKYFTVLQQREVIEGIIDALEDLGEETPLEPVETSSEEE